jgi:hypothetical protein
MHVEKVYAGGRRFDITSLNPLANSINNQVGPVGVDVRSDSPLKFSTTRPAPWIMNIKERMA